MIKSFLEMGFSVDGLHPKNCDGIFTNREGFLFKKQSGKYTPLRPYLGNRGGIGTRGAYFYFTFDNQKYKVYQEEIQEHGLDAKAHKI